MKYQHHPKQEYEELEALKATFSAHQSDLQNSNPEPMKQEAGFYPAPSISSFHIQLYFREPTLFERFNSLCTPAEYVQLKKEILEAFVMWVKDDPGASWPKELEGFTEEILEML